MPPPLKDRIREEALRIGFDLAGVAEAKPADAAGAFRAWLASGREGEMAWMRRDPETRVDPRRLEPWARSIVSVAASYDADAKASTDPRPPSRGWISRYAWGEDYHDRMKGMLCALADRIRALGPAGTRTKACVDTAAILDRAAARAAGLGWIGKNTLLLNRRFGSFLFLGEVLTDLALSPDPLATGHCGSCTKCLDACPTQALVEPGVLDARRCIAYLTIELKGPIPEPLRPAMGTHLFGCDICQDVCPWNRKSPKTARPEYQPRPGLVAPPIASILSLTREEHRARFKKSPVKRAKYEGLLRNACVAAGNSGDPALLPSLAKASQASSLVAEHAAWAARQIRAAAASAPPPALVRPPAAPLDGPTAAAENPRQAPIV